MKKVLIFILLISLAAFISAGCTQSAQSGSITITDLMGNEVVFEKLPEKIIAMMPVDVEVIYALGAQDKLIAVGEYANYPEDTVNKTSVGTGMNTNLEELIGLEPDLIIIGHMAQTADQADRLKEAGIAVMSSNAQTIEDTYKTIVILGQVTGKTQAAEQIVKSMQEGLAAIKEKVKDKPVLNVYVEVSPLQYGLWTAGQGTFIHELLDILNVRNVFEEIEGWASISEEQVIDKDPEVILTTVGVGDGVGNPVEDILERENWTSIQAVATEMVFMVNSDTTTRPGPRLLNAAQEIYALLHE